MKKGLLIFSIMVSVLFAKTPYEEAISAFKNKNYKKAFEIFDKNRASYYNNTLYNYYYGLSSYMMGKYELALSAFERILFDNPNHHYAKFQLAKTYLKLYMYEDAKNEFEDLLDDPTFPNEAKPKIKQYLKIAKKYIKNSTINATVGVGVYYDSNINKTPESEKVFIPSFNTYVTSSSTKEDFYHQEFLSLKHSTDIFGRGKWSLSNDVFVLNKGYFKEKDENSLYLGYYPTLSYKTSSYVASIMTQVMKAYKGGHGYQTAYFISPSIDFLIFNDIKTTLKASYSLQRYDDINKKEYDSHTTEGSIAFSNIKIKNIYPSFKFTYGKELKRYNQRTDVSNKYGSAELSVLFPLNSSLFARWTNKYEMKHYIDYNRFFQNRRKDDLITSKIALTYQLSPTFIGELYYAYHHNNSNQSLYDYEKSSAGLAIYKMLSD